MFPYDISGTFFHILMIHILFYFIYVIFAGSRVSPYTALTCRDSSVVFSLKSVGITGRCNHAQPQSLSQCTLRWGCHSIPGIEPSSCICLSMYFNPLSYLANHDQILKIKPSYDFGHLLQSNLSRITLFQNFILQTTLSYEMINFGSLSS